MDKHAGREGHGPGEARAHPAVSGNWSGGPTQTGLQASEKTWGLL